MEIKWSRDVAKQSSAKGNVKLHALFDAGIVRDGGKYSRAANFTPAEDAKHKKYVTANYDAMFGSFGGRWVLPHTAKKLAVVQPDDEVRLLSGRICLRAEIVVVISDTSYRLDVVSHSSCNCYGVLECQWKDPVT